MLDIFRIILVFCLILVLLRGKVSIGYVMGISAGAIFLLYRTAPGDMIVVAQKTMKNPVTVKLLFALSLIRVFELMLREQGLLVRMMEAVKKTVRSRRAVIVSMPLVIGMLPSLGGAYFSAPMVEEATQGHGLTQEEKAFVNYWFRHPWEFVLPLYPGILLAAAVSGTSLSRLVLANLLPAAALLLAGFAFSMRSLGKRRRISAEQRSSSGLSRKELVSFLPIAALLLMVMVFHIELHYALVAAIAPLFLLFRYQAKDAFRLLRHGFTLEVIVLILGIMFFKEAFEGSGAVGRVSAFLLEQRIPPLPLICLLPFIAGLLTGHTVGFVGSTFPLVLSIGGASLPEVSFAFCAGFLGVLFSPVHLCLVLTREYFRADAVGMYRRIAPAGLCVFGVVVAEYLLFFMVQTPSLPH